MTTPAPEFCTLNIRNVPIDTRDRMNRAAASRGMNQAEYLVALVNLHAAIRSLADDATINPLANLRDVLDLLRLNTVRS